MNHRLPFSLGAISLSAIIFSFAAWRRPSRLLLLLTAFSLSASAQNWSPFIDSSRAIDWSKAGFTIPNYSVNCSTQPTLTAGSGAASANSTAIQNALASCDAAHNVVNIPAGTYYVAGTTYPSHGHQVIRGAGPNSTTIIFTTETGCSGGLTASGFCMKSASPVYNGSAEVLPGGYQQCQWTAGYAKGSTTLTLSNCPGAPPVNRMMILDQANDTSDTGGIYICDGQTPGCTYEGLGSPDGRNISGVVHSQQQITYVTGVTPLGGGSYTVTISPGVYFNNIRSGKNPGAWWSDFVQNNGLENITLDGTNVPDTTVAMLDCYQCWVKNVRFLNGARSDVLLFQSAQDVIRDSYFYQAQSHHSVSYTIDPEVASGVLVENNIFQQVTTPMVINAGTGIVGGYNFSINNIYDGSTTYAAATYNSHNAGSDMNLWEGNNFLGIWADNAWGSSVTATYFRNMLIGWQGGKSDGTTPIIFRSYVRAYNLAGNVMGQPGYHSQYQTYATSTTAGTGGSAENRSIYSLGWGGTGPACDGSVPCDPLAFSTLMRWGNYDTVTGGIKWDAAEASPGAVAYTNTNFSSSYFGSLAHTLPASLYYNSKPSWWPSSKAWPPVGPDVSAGNLGTCSGTYAGAQATSTSQCAGGTLTSAWASHATSIPAQDCYLSVMHGPPDGTGGVLSFDANQCYASSGTSGTGPASPTGLTATVVAN